MSITDDADDESVSDDTIDVKAFYPMLAELSPEDWEDGAAYGLPQCPRSSL